MARAARTLRASLRAMRASRSEPTRKETDHEQRSYAGLDALDAGRGEDPDDARGAVVARRYAVRSRHELGRDRAQDGQGRARAERQDARDDGPHARGFRARARE